MSTLDRPRKRAPNMELWSEQPMPEGAWQDLLDFVRGIRPENVDSFYILVNKKRSKRRVESERREK